MCLRQPVSQVADIRLPSGFGAAVAPTRGRGGEVSEDVEAASETATDQEDQTKEPESGGDKEPTKGTGGADGRNGTARSKVSGRARVEVPGYARAPSSYRRS
ncbi:hypothetical protein Z043_119734 [Scleropages formosus]|uniref:Uncharacterized protein n=1 Tax=Scleropages formosus TaxID=113540 RepID=A0A0P7WM27_SCLFO|nr:hypothetical protein Z043_119734 [Scleropages formosus]